MSVPEVHPAEHPRPEDVPPIRVWEWTTARQNFLALARQFGLQ